MKIFFNFSLDTKFNTAYNSNAGTNIPRGSKKRLRG